VSLAIGEAEVVKQPCGNALFWTREAPLADQFITDTMDGFAAFCSGSFELF
jgi:hypothetical protein